MSTRPRVHRRYNELCKAGEDTDFFKSFSACSPWRNGPFYG